MILGFQTPTHSNSCKWLAWLNFELHGVVYNLRRSHLGILSQPGLYTRSSERAPLQQP